MYWEIVDTKNGTFVCTTRETFIGFEFIARKCGAIVYQTDDPEKASAYMEKLKGGL